MYEVEEIKIWGANVISLHLMMGAIQFFVVGCYIPPSDLETLTDVDKAWRACPVVAHPILVGELNFNLCAPHKDRKETIAEQVDAMDLVDMSRHFCQCSGKRLRRRWTGQMRREGTWISLQCDYFFGRETDQQRFRCVSIRMSCYFYNHRALVAVIYAKGGGGDLSKTNDMRSHSPSPSPAAPGHSSTLNTRSCSRTWYAPP